MNLDQRIYHILVIEDNEGDYVLIEDLLLEKILKPELYWAKSFAEAKRYLCEKPHFDLILLDLTLPDIQGMELIQAVLSENQSSPVVVLTGYADIDFGVSSLALGTSDYLLKDELSASALYKAIRYAIERNHFFLKLASSEKRYMDLFHFSPQPMWVFDWSSLKILNVNRAAMEHYGYNKQEFLNMSMLELQTEQDPLILKNCFSKPTMTKDGKIQHEILEYCVLEHKKKNGEKIEVELKTSSIFYEGHSEGLALGHDVTERFNYIKTIEEQNTVFRDITWLQSHVVRAPLARILGLTDLIEHSENADTELRQWLKHLQGSARELDLIIHEIHQKTDLIIQTNHLLTEPKTQDS